MNDAMDGWKGATELTRRTRESEWVADSLARRFLGDDRSADELEIERNVECV